MSGVNKTTHRLLDKIVEPDINASEVEVDIQFDPDDPSSIPVVEVSSVDWSAKEAAIILKHIEDFGIHTGIPYTRTVSNDTNSLLLIDGYLDPAGIETELECNRISNIPVIQRKKNNWLTESSKNVLFNILLSNGTITTDDYVQVPYIINTIPNYTEAAIATVSSFVVLQKMIEISREVGKVIGGLLSGLGVIGAIIKLVLVAAWVIVVIGQIIIFLIDIFDHLIQPIKYHAGMKWRRLLEAGCEHLGLTFRSSIFDQPKYANAIILPAKQQSFDDVRNANSLGFTVPNTMDNGYYKKSFFDLLALTKTTFNAKIILNADKELIIERVDASTDPATLTLPDLPLDKYKTNANEIIGNYEVAFLTDLSDNGTIDNYEGTVTNAITTSTSDGVQDTKVIPNYLLRQIDLARANRKPDLTDMEERFNILFQNFPKQVNKVIDITNKVVKVRNKIIKPITKLIKKLKVIGININFNPEPIPPLPNITTNSIIKRIGMMSISVDFFEKDKVLTVDIASDPSLTKVSLDNNTIWHSESLYNEFHVTQSHAVTDEFPTGNQFRRYELGEFRLCLDDVIKVINNNLIFTKDGRTAKIEEARWNDFYGVLKNGKIRIAHVDDPFLETKLVTPNGL